MTRTLQMMAELLHIDAVLCAMVTARAHCALKWLSTDPHCGIAEMKSADQR